MINITRILLTLLVLITSDVLLMSQQDWLVLEDENYKVEYPADWSTDQSGISGSWFVIYKDSDEDFKNNLNLNGHFLEGKNLEWFTTMVVGEIAQDFVITNQRGGEENRMPYFQIEYKNKKNKELSLRYLHRVYFVNDFGLNLQFTALSSEFDSLRKDVEQMMNSIEIMID